MAASQAKAPASSGGWKEQDELGTDLGMKALLFLLRLPAGRFFARLCLSFVVAYYVLVYARVRSPSRDYLRRVGVSPSLVNVYRHVRTFAFCSLDRFFFMDGTGDDFDITRVNMDIIAAHQAAGKGGVLLGAHLGSFEVLRTGSRRSRTKVNVVMDTANATLMRKYLRSTGGEGTVGILEVSEGGIDLVLKARECVERGEFVAILADRVGEGQRAVTVPFLGGDVRIPVGPFIIASQLRAPVFLIVGLYRGGKKYDLMCEPFADPMVLPRGNRESAAAEYATRYTQSLERYCREAPFNWFNFFDYWTETDRGATGENDA